MHARRALSVLPIAALGACGPANGTASDAGSDARHSSSSGGSSTSSSGSSGSSAGSNGSSSSGGGEGGSAPDASVLLFHNHVNRDGFFVDPAMSATAAASVHRDTTFGGALSGNVYGSPVYLQNKGATGTFYVATESDTVYALDEVTGTVDWHVSVGTPATSTGAGCGNIGPLGITGTPAIDPATNVLVLDAAVAGASGSVATHTILGLSLADGSTRWSVDVSRITSGGLTFSPQAQNQRSAVLIVNGVAYVAYGGHYGDCGNYHGWVVGVPLANPAAATGWATQVAGAGIWGAGGPASDGESIYVTTGNGIGGPATWAESEGVLRLGAGPSFTETSADCWAPSNWQALDTGDTDLSGSGPLVLDAPSMSPSTLVMAQGKDGYLYLLDRTDLGGAGATPLGRLRVESGSIVNAGASATIADTTYVVVRPNQGGTGIGCPNGTAGDLVAVKLDPTAAERMTVAWCADAMGEGSPIITTTDGSSNALVWSVGAQSSNALHAWDLATGALVFQGGTAADQIPDVRRFTSPIVVHGRVFVGGDNALYALQP